MFRRSRLLSSTAALTAVALSASLAGCSTFTDNDLAAKTGGTELSAAELDELIVDFPKVVNIDLTPDAIGEINGDQVRQVLSTWAQINVLESEIERLGLGPDDARRSAIAADLQAADDQWDSYSSVTQALLIGSTVIAETSGELADPADLEALYNEGVGSTGMLCVRGAAFATEADALAALEEFRAGADFAAIADANPFSPDAPVNGGISVDPTTGAECFNAQDQPQLASELAEVAVGDSSDPLPAGEEFYLIFIRPFDEVAAEVSDTLGSSIAQITFSAMFERADVSIDSRYGMWNGATGAVVPTR